MEDRPAALGRVPREPSLAGIPDPNTRGQAPVERPELPLTPFLLSSQNTETFTYDPVLCGTNEGRDTNAPPPALPHPHGQFRRLPAKASGSGGGMWVPIWRTEFQI